jgi:ubiquinone/menaquinone biosynthesis C-methylase UbiE
MSGLDGAWKALGRQLRHPSGFPGRVIGHAMSVANRRPNRIAIDALEIAPDDVVLELGFGPGRAIAQLASSIGTGHILGIDQSAAMLTQASRHNRQAIKRGRVALRHGRFDALPWPAASVDKVLAVNTAYFFRLDAIEIQEAKRVLRPGGLMALYATDRSVMARWQFSGPDTHRTFDRESLAALLRTGGFDDGDVTVTRVDIGFGIAGLLALGRKPIGIVGDQQARR